jgi:hypothetical protein
MHLVQAYIPKIIQCEQLGNFFKQVFIKRGKNFQILHEDIYSLGPIKPINSKYLRAANTIKM